jgi:hypothetical protein
LKTLQLRRQIGSRLDLDQASRGLIGPDGKLVKNKNGGAAHNCAEARRYLEALPDRRILR